RALQLEICLRQTASFLYIAVDRLVPERGKGIAGFDEFTAALDHAGVPAVWLTRRSRLQFDEPRRKLGHAHPFIGEDGCGVYLPEDYFHLRPESGNFRSRPTSTLRLGRFTCIPLAEPLPAASDALESLSQESGVPVVTEDLAPSLFPFCDRSILLADHTAETETDPHRRSRARKIRLLSRDVWEQVLESVASKA